MIFELNIYACGVFPRLVLLLNLHIMEFRLEIKSRLQKGKIMDVNQHTFWERWVHSSQGLQPGQFKDKIFFLNKKKNK